MGILVSDVTHACLYRTSELVEFDAVVINLCALARLGSTSIDRGLVGRPRAGVPHSTPTLFNFQTPTDRDRRGGSPEMGL